MKTGLRLTFYGMVQGVGFRPFVAEEAEKYGLAGTVQNSGGLVTAEVYGEREAVSAFLLSVRKNPPAGARVDRIKKTLWAPLPEPVDFRIIHSEDRADAVRFLPPDLPVCDSCVQELLDKSNRRYRYPFISCTACGPRYTIMREVPYDRASTTMGHFPMCPSCASEYSEAGGRRRHAQTISCPDCGPTLTAYWKNNKADGEAALETAVRVLKDGGIVAVRDIGGFHLCFRADCAEAARRLRVWKHREEKPFAVMFPDVSAVRQYCEVSEKEEELLTSNPRPIVLLRQKDRNLWPEVSCHSDRCGAFLPCSPLQILLLNECGPLVMTSGNRGGGVIETKADLFLETLQTEGFPDLVLTHDREILTPLDDSIFQVTAGNRIQILRRARGIVPEAIHLPRKLPGDCFAAGGDLKNVFAFGRDSYVWAGGHYGDLEEDACRRAREEGIEHLGTLLGFPFPFEGGDGYRQFNASEKGSAVGNSSTIRNVGDLHPRYFSSQDAEQKFQHHLCHTMSVAAECGVTGRVLGISFDGTGYGTDGTIWGSEFLDIHIPDGKNESAASAAESAHTEGGIGTADALTWHRAGHLSAFLLQGGDEGARDARKTADALMRQGRRSGADTPLFYPDEEEKILEAADRLGLNEVSCTSMGRLFDAAAYILGIADYNHYEGQCPIELEIAVHEYENECLRQRAGASQKYESVAHATLPLDLSIRIEKNEKGCLVGNPLPLLVSLYRRKAAGEDVSKLAYFFHLAIAKWTAAMAAALAPADVPVLLSGGTFLNRLLTGEVLRLFEVEGRSVFLNRLVPPGDGGLFLGQMYLLTFSQVEEH